MRRTTPTKGAKGKADRLFSLLVREAGVCAACGWACPCPEAPRHHTADCRLQCAHIISRRFSRTRCDLRNAVALCAKCHHHYTDNPVLWGRWVDGMFPGRHDEMAGLAHGTQKVDWQQVADDLTALARERGVL